MTEYSVIGKATPNVDGFAKVTGQAQYTFDIVLPRMLYGKILRSPYSHAKILNIDTSKAEKLAGVKAVITAKETGEHKQGCWRRFRELCDEPMLCLEKVRYIGDPVAAVAAIDEDIAEEALDLIEVEYEPLPAVFDPLEAEKEGAPQLHDEFKNNINVSRSIEWGDVEEGFKNSDHIREDRFVLAPQSHTPLETHGALASFDGNGRLTIWTSTQTPYYVQCLLAETLEMGENDVRVIKPHVGGGFGGKNELFADQFCSSFLSRKTGRPVKIVYSREEEFTCARRRIPMHYYLKIGAKRDGTLLAKEVRVVTDGGAYTSMNPTGLYLTGWFSLSSFPISTFSACSALIGTGAAAPRTILVSAAVSITLSSKDDTCSDARIVLGAAAPVPMRAEQAEKVLIGKELKENLLKDAGKVASEEARPIADMHASEEYRQELVRVLVKRVAGEAWEKAKRG